MINRHALERQMANMHDSKRLRGFGNGQTDGQMDICNSRVAFATVHTGSRIFWDSLR